MAASEQSLSSAPPAVAAGARRVPCDETVTGRPGQVWETTPEGMNDLEELYHAPWDTAVDIILDEREVGLGMPPPEGSALPELAAASLRPRVRACPLPEGENPGYDAPLPAPVPAREGIRTAIVTSYDIGKAFYKAMTCKKFESIAALLWYGSTHPSRGGKKGVRKQKINPEELSTLWVEVVYHLSTGHDKDTLDLYESKLDECLLPILRAPVAQLREFYRLLVEKLKADARIPFFVWRGFEVWAEKDILTAPDEDVIELRTVLAREITDLVAPEVQKDIMEAMVNALQWRSAGKLKEIRDAVKAGGKPRAQQRVRGHESCLFLDIVSLDGKEVATVQI